MQNVLEEFLKISAAINDETRVLILAFLASHTKGDEKMLCVCDLQNALNLNQSRLSRHLKILKDAGFLELERKGVWAYYAIKKELSQFHKDILKEIYLLKLC